MKDTNLKLAKASKSKVTPKGKTNKKINQKGNKKTPQKQKNDNKYAWKKFPPKQVEKETKTINDNIYNFFEWHKAWVEHYPEVKVSDGCLLYDNL